MRNDEALNAVDKSDIQFLELNRLHRETPVKTYFENFFSGTTRGKIDKLEKLKNLAEEVCSERGILEPCVAYLCFGKEKILLVDNFNEPIFFSCKPEYSENYIIDSYSDKGDTPFGWGRPNLTVVIEKDHMEEKEGRRYLYEEFKLGACTCNHGAEESLCSKECEFYSEVERSRRINCRRYIYV